ncbi:cytochrome P450 oxidoreductase [Usnea florida]
MALHSWLGLGLIVMLVIRSLSFRYTYGLRRFNGPLLASFTDAWRLFYNYRNTGIPFRDLHDRWGKVVRVGPNALSFQDPQAMRDIFGAGKNWNKSDLYFVNAPVSKGKYAHTLFSSTDPTWHKNVRRAMNPFFTRTAVLTYEPFVERTIQAFLTEIDHRFADKGGSRGVIDFHNWLSFFTFDVISDLTYSKRHGFISQAKDMYGIIAWVANFVQYSFVAGQMPWVDLLLRHNPLLMWLERRGWYMGNTFPGATFALQRIRNRDQQKPTEIGDNRREDLLDKFRQARRERPEHITEQEVLGLSLSTMLAGAETTSISLTAVFYYILRTPGCYTKLREELDTQLQSTYSDTDFVYFRAPFSESRELPYLHACVQEAFRMHPAFGFMLERVVPPSGGTIHGNHIPGGTIVGCNPWIVQRDKDTFGEDSDTYRPERWLVDRKAAYKMERAMFHFGAGNHLCLGQNIAWMEIYKLVPSLIRTYEISLVDPEKEWTVVNGGVMRQTDFHVRMKRRSDLVDDRVR